MIKFKYLIHKETGTVINYLDWEKRLGLDMWFILTDKTKQFNYKPKEMLFSDDFEIVYDSEFADKLEKFFKADWFLVNWNTLKVDINDSCETISSIKEFDNY